MPHKDPEARRAYMRAHWLKIKEEDPDRAAKRAQQQAAWYEKKKATDEAWKNRRDEQQKKWKDQHGLESSRRCRGSKPLDEHLADCDAKRQAHADYMREYYRTDAGRRKLVARAIKKRCGLSIEQYDEAYASQQGKCRICGTFREPYKQDRLGVDHCHETGQFRALLCSNCNSAIGLLGERESVLHAAIQYLQDIEQGNVGVSEEVGIQMYSQVETHMVHLYHYFGSGEAGRIVSQKMFAYRMLPKMELIEKCVPR